MFPFGVVWSLHSVKVVQSATTPVGRSLCSLTLLTSFSLIGYETSLCHCQNGVASYTISAKWKLVSVVSLNPVRAHLQTHSVCLTVLSEIHRLHITDIQSIYFFASSLNLANKIYQNCGCNLVPPYGLILPSCAWTAIQAWQMVLCLRLLRLCLRLPYKLGGQVPPSVGRPTGSLPPSGRMNSWGQKAPS